MKSNVEEGQQINMFRMSRAKRGFLKFRVMSNEVK